MLDSPLYRLLEWSRQHGCALLAVSDEDSAQDGASAALLRLVLGSVDDLGSRPALMLLVTPERLMVHCSASALDGVRSALKAMGAPLPVDMLSPSPQHSPDSDAALDFKLEAAQRMLKEAHGTVPALLAGLAPLADVLASWPLLQALSPAPPDQASRPTVAAVAALHVLLRAVDASALQAQGELAERAHRVAAGFGRLTARLDNVDDSYEMGEVTEKALEAGLRGSDERFVAPPAEPPYEGTHSGVWLGARTDGCFDVPGGRKNPPVRASGPHSRVGRHLTARLADEASGVGATRSYFLSNGLVPHHWQHRVFPDGEVLEPLVEDEVPAVDGAAGVRVSMLLYCEMMAAAAEVVAAAAAACPAPLSEGEAAAVLVRRLEAARAAGLLPKDFDVAANAQVGLWRGVRASPLHSASPPDATGGGDGATGGDAPDAPTEAAIAEAAAAAPLHWQLHRVMVRLRSMPRLAPKEKKEKGTVEGGLAYEDTFVLDGRGGAAVLTACVPRLCAWGGTGAEVSETRSTQGALESTEVCAHPDAVVERLRAGEHHVLQVLCARPAPRAALLVDSPWLPVVRGEARLYQGGLALVSPRHGPLVLPFRIHLAAVATYRLDCLDGCGLLLLRQKPDTHAYGPLAMLPRAMGAEPPDAEDPLPVAMSLALVVPAGSELQHALREVVWPAWSRLFRECNIPCDNLPAVPAELRAPLAQLQCEAAAVPLTKGGVLV